MSNKTCNTCGTLGSQSNWIRNRECTQCRNIREIAEEQERYTNPVVDIEFIEMYAFGYFKNGYINSIIGTPNFDLDYLSNNNPEGYTIITLRIPCMASTN